jgi:hypothetical protein
MRQGEQKSVKAFNHSITNPFGPIPPISSGRGCNDLISLYSSACDHGVLKCSRAQQSKEKALRLCPNRRRKRPQTVAEASLRSLGSPRLVARCSAFSGSSSAFSGSSGRGGRLREWRSRSALGIFLHVQSQNGWHNVRLHSARTIYLGPRILSRRILSFVNCEVIQDRFRDVVEKRNRV